MSFRNTKTPLKPDCKPRYEVPMRPDPKSGVQKYYLVGETLAAFVRLFPIHSNRRIMAWFGLSYATVQRFKRELGLQKDMRKIRKQQAADTKKICERNGYYASLRGKHPPEACLEAARKLREAGFNPIQRLKETDRRKYNRTRRKISAARKELIRKERLREEYGLERKTKLRLGGLPHRAAAHKWAMIRLCDYFADPADPHAVCYDSQTRRSAKREATAERHGLHIVEGED